MGAVRELKPTVVRAYSRSADDLGLGRVPWPNVAPGDVLELAGGDVVRVVDVVLAAAGSDISALVKVERLPSAVRS